jgi:hypothetical protein
MKRTSLFTADMIASTILFISLISTVVIIYIGF